MSLERRRETKGTVKEEVLRDSKFRRLDFTPLEKKKETKGKKKKFRFLLMN